MNLYFQFLLKIKRTFHQKLTSIQYKLTSFIEFFKTSDILVLFFKAKAHTKLLYYMLNSMRKNIHLYNNG